MMISSVTACELHHIESRRD